jgi:hypothetical protein
MDAAAQFVRIVARMRRCGARGVPITHQSQELPMLRSRWLLLFLPLLLLLGNARGAPLVDRPPIAIPASATPEQVANAIHQAFVHRGWKIETDQPGRIEGSLRRDEHSVRVAISYDSQQITISYVSSENMDYSQGPKGPQIHRKYLSWVKYLDEDINTVLKGGVAALK